MIYWIILEKNVSLIMKETANIIWMSFLFSMASFFCIGQTNSIDSLKKKMWAEAEPGNKLQLLIDLCEHHQSINKDSLYQYARLAKKLELKNNTQNEKGAVMLILINTYLRLGNIDSATALVEEGLSNNTLKDPATRSMYFKLAALKVDCLGDASNYKDALSELYKIIYEAEQFRDSLVLSKNMSTIGVINYNLDHIAEAFNWYFKGISYINSNDSRFYSSAIVLYINLAETYRWVQQTDSASYYINKAIPLSQQTGNLFFLANSLRVKANIYKEKKEYPLAEKTMLECIEIREKTEGKLTMSNEQLAIAGIYLRSGNTDKAIKVLSGALLLNNVKGNEADPMRISYYQTLAKCYQLKGDSKNYQQTLEKIITSKDAFYQANSAHAIAELQTKYEVQKKESTIIKQQFDLTRQYYLFYGLLLLLLFITTVAWLLFKEDKKRQQLKMRQIQEEEKRLSIKAVTEAEEAERKRIAADLHDSLGAYAASIASNIDHLHISETNKGNRIALQQLRSNSQSIISQLSNTIWALKKEVFSLTAISDRIKIVIQRLQNNYPEVTFDVCENIETDYLLSPTHAFDLFQIMQESINNALRHSEGSHINILIEAGQQWKIIIEDNGKGINSQRLKAEGGNGLTNMRNRAQHAGWGILWQQNTPCGTSVIISSTTN